MPIIAALLLNLNSPSPNLAFASGEGFEERQTSTVKRSKKKVTRKKKPSRSSKKKVIRKKKRKAKRSSSSSSVPKFRNRQLLVAFPFDASETLIDLVAQEYRLSRINDAQIGLLDKRVVKFRTRRSFSARQIQQLADDPRTGIVQSNFLYILTAGSPAQYAAQKLRYTEVHKITLGEGVQVAVLDSGVYAKHPAINGSVLKQFDAIGKSGYRNSNHGTGISSIIAATNTVLGIAPKAQILSARVFASKKRGRPQVAESFNLLRGLDWAVENNAAIINMSFAGPSDPLFHDIIKAAQGKGVIMVAAVGNQGSKKPVAFPAAYDEVIASTATDSKNRLYRHANRGGQVAFAAPGVGILVAKKKRGFGLMSGTSVATAFISGAIALLLQSNPQLKATDIIERLSSTSHDLGAKGRDNKFGYGLLNVLRAIEEQQ